MIVYKVKGVEQPREFRGTGYILIANKNSCPFCSYCTDIFYDFTNGPYWFFCSKHDDITLEEILKKGCCDYE